MMPKNTSKIIVYLLRNIDLVNINQIARFLDISVGSAFAVLKSLEEKNIVRSSSLGNAKYFALNFKEVQARRLCEFILLEEKRELHGVAKVYAEELDKFASAELMMLFGSILTSKNFNDVDVLFITSKTSEVTSFCLEVSKIRVKPVVPFILKKRDLVKEIRLKQEAVLEIIKNGIVLKGESVFVEVINDART